jgi:hypothetical protein
MFHLALFGMCLINVSNAVAEPHTLRVSDNSRYLVKAPDCISFSLDKIFGTL